MNIRLEVVGDKQIKARLNLLMVRLSPPSMAGFLRGMALPYLQKQARDTWFTMGRYHEWDAPARDYGWPLLHKTGELFGRVSSSGDVKTSPLGAHLEFPSSGDIIDKYVWHQAGTKDGHIPARPMVRLTPADHFTTLGMLDKYIGGFR